MKPEHVDALVERLEKIHRALDTDGKASGAANQKKAAQDHKASTAAAKKKLAELETKRTASRTPATKIDAKRGHPTGTKR